MALRRLLGIFLVVIAVTDALIEFQKSRIYDETDFDDEGIIMILNYCSAGCRIYVSIPRDSIEVARNLCIKDGAKTTSFAEANTKNEEDNRIQPYIVEVGHNRIDFSNDNDDLESAPILVWLVQGDAPNIDAAEVYDAYNTARLQAPISGPITFMNAETFIVTTETIGPMSVIAYTAGFDALSDDDKCTRVLEQTNPAYYQDVLVSVRSPLITFSFDNTKFPATTVGLKAAKDPRNTFDLKKPMFASSPGYIGCAVKNSEGTKKTFRSSLYENTTDYLFTSNDAFTFSLTSYQSVDEDHRVSTIVDDGVPTIWSIATSSGTFTGKKLEISWTSNEDDFDQYFMMRVEPVHFEPVQTTSEEPIKTTTGQSEPDKTTADAGYTTSEEPVKTTTPEPEPKATTDSGPGPDHERTTTEEPVKTTTRELEPVKTTTEEEIRTTTEEPVKTTTNADPGPDHKSTTAEEPVPVKTTTAEPEEPSKTTTPEPVEPENTEPTEKPTTPRYTRKSTTLPLRTTPSTDNTPDPNPKPTTTVNKPPTTTTSTVVPPTTSGAAYGSLLLSIFTGIAVLLL